MAARDCQTTAPLATGTAALPLGRHPRRRSTAAPAARALRASLPVGLGRLVAAPPAEPSGKCPPWCRHSLLPQMPNSSIPCSAQYSFIGFCHSILGIAFVQSQNVDDVPILRGCAVQGRQPVPGILGGARRQPIRPQGRGSRALKARPRYCWREGQGPTKPAPRCVAGPAAERDAQPAAAGHAATAAALSEHVRLSRRFVPPRIWPPMYAADTAIIPGAVLEREAGQSLYCFSALPVFSAPHLLTRSVLLCAVPGPGWPSVSAPEAAAAAGELHRSPCCHLCVADSSQDAAPGPACSCAGPAAHAGRWHR